MPARNADVHSTFAGYDVDRRDADVPLPRRLWLLPRNVRHSPFRYSTSWTHHSRPHRSSKGSSSKGSGSAQRTYRSATSAENIPAVPISPNELQVAVHTSSEQWQCQHSKKAPYVSFINLDGELSDKSPGPARSFDEDLESNSEK